MYVCLNGSLLAGAKVGWPEFAHMAARLGYPGTEIYLSRAMSEGLDSTRALLKTLKLKPAATDLLVEFRKDEATFQADLKKLEPTVKFSASIGAPGLLTWILPSSDTPKAELRKIYKDRFQAVAAILAPSRMRLGLEFVSPVHLRKLHPYEFIWRMDEMLDFCKECGPNVGLLLDAWHWHHAGATTRDIEDAGAERIVHVHVSDAPKLPPEQIRDNQRLMPGEGVIDLAGFFQALKKVGYKYGVSPEVLGRLKKDTAPEDGARLGLQTTLVVMKKAGAV